MSGFDNEVMYAKNADFTATNNQNVLESNGLVTNSQMWIGSTATNVGGTHINVGTLTSPNSSITFGYSSPNITAVVNGASVGQTITGDTGGALSPTAGNWNILGQQAGSIAVMDTIGTAPSTLRVEDRSYTTAFVVDPSSTAGLKGTFTTIQAAITAASVGTTIFIRPGTYVENLTMKAGVNLQGYEASAYGFQTIINGTISCTYVGTSAICGLELYNTTTDIISITGGSQTKLVVKDCTILQDATSGSHYAFTCSNGAAELRVVDCNGNLNTNGAYFNISAGVYIGFDNCNFRSDGLSTVANAISGTVTVFLNNTELQNKTSMTGGILQTFSSKLGREDVTQIVLAMVASRLRAYYTDFSTVTSTVITIDATSVAEFVQCCMTSDAPTGGNLITNAGTITYDQITQRDPSAGPGQGVIPTPTTSVISYYGTCSFKQGQIVAVTTPGAYPYTTLQSDYLILVDTSTARTITPMASPVTGLTYRIKDNSGTAGTNNITVTPSGKNIDGAASYVINTNYGSVDITYNGTQWSVL